VGSDPASPLVRSRQLGRFLPPPSPAPGFALVMGRWVLTLQLRLPRVPWEEGKRRPASGKALSREPESQRRAPGLGSSSPRAVTGSHCSSIARIPLHGGPLPTACVDGGWSSHGALGAGAASPGNARTAAMGSSSTRLLCAAPLPRLSVETVGTGTREVSRASLPHAVPERAAPAPLSTLPQPL